MGRDKWYMGTIIIVDKIGRNSRIVDLAKQIDGTIVQMSMAYWPQDVARELRRLVGHHHILADMEQSEIASYLQTELEKVPLDELIGAEAG